MGWSNLLQEVATIPSSWFQRVSHLEENEGKWRKSDKNGEKVKRAEEIDNYSRVEKYKITKYVFQHQ